MRLERLTYEPGAALRFFEEGLAALGAVCEQTWHDRLEVLAEGRAAGLFGAEKNEHAGELVFAPADATSAREASREVFPGCPLTFRLAEALRPAPVPLDRIVLEGDPQAGRVPESAVVEKLWRAQFPATGSWRLTGPFKSGFHFSLLGLVRCEIQAIDQHWSLHRMAVGLPEGVVDSNLAAEIGFARAGTSEAGIAWPSPDVPKWSGFLRQALEQDLEEEISALRKRQEHSLRRELDRVDQYFANYERELEDRSRRSGSADTKSKMVGRLQAARGEHARRRADQVSRHEVRVLLHLEALLLTAEPAWTAEVRVEHGRVVEAVGANFVPRARQWHRLVPG